MKCPLCGKVNPITRYDPSNFDNDILIVKFRGLGRGKGFEVAEKYSLLDGSNPALLALIRDRVAVIHDFLYENRSEDQDDLIDDINAALDVHEGFDNLHDATKALLGQFLESDEVEDKGPAYTEEGALVVGDQGSHDDYESLTELDKEIRLGEAAEEEGEEH